MFFRKQLNEEKVFGIGFGKTGTTSLGSALNILGMNTSGWSDDRLNRSYHFWRYANVIKRFDAFEDEPFSSFYQTLDAIFPNAKFILTLRDEQAWIESCHKHFGRYEGIHSNRPQNLRRLDAMFLEKKYGKSCPISNEPIWREKYNAHQDEVSKYFRGRPQKLLTLDLTTDSNPWNKICLFLNKEIPNVSFPIMNKNKVSH